MTMAVTTADLGTSSLILSTWWTPQVAAPTMAPPSACTAAVVHSSTTVSA